MLTYVNIRRIIHLENSCCARKRLLSGEIVFLGISVNTFNYYDMTLNVQIDSSDARRF